METRSNLLPRIGGLCVLHMTFTSLIMYGLFYSRYRAQKKPLQYFLLAFGAACVLHGSSTSQSTEAGAFSASNSPDLLHSGVRCLYQLHLEPLKSNPKGSKRQLELTEYLCYSLAAIVMLQYVAMAVKYGPGNANSAFRWTAIFSYFWLCMILVNLGPSTYKSGYGSRILRRKAKFPFLQ